MNKTYYIRLKNDLKLDKIKEPEKICERGLETIFIKIHQHSRNIEKVGRGMI